MTPTPTAPRQPSSFYLYPGDLHVSSSGETISTLLGTCVSVALYDCLRGVGGMNHYLLSVPTGGRDGSTGETRYAHRALTVLLDSMLTAGARREQIEAKVFGGALRGDSESPQARVARENVRAALEALERWGIPIRAVDTGGPHGRRVFFSTATGRAMVRLFRWPETKEVSSAT
ncbi:MAG: chemotaxis protein CheD [Spirochaetota bacterium]